MPKAKYNFELPVEGWNKKTLPLIPNSGLLQPIPLKPEYGAHTSDRYVSIHPPTGVCGERTKSPCDRAIDAVQIIQRYNRYVNLLQESEDGKQRELSSRFIELGSDITAAVRKLDREVQLKLWEMGRISQQMFQKLELEDACFSNGSWSCTFILEHGIGVRWLIQYEGLTTEELRAKLNSLPSTDPGHLVELMSGSLEQAFWPSKHRLFIANFHVILDHLVSLQDGKRLALDLCLALHMSRLLLWNWPGEEDSQTIIYSSSTMGLHLTALRLLGLSRPSRAEPATTIRHYTDIDASAIKRRLWMSMKNKGCAKLYKGSVKDADCVCYRRASLGLLQQLQILAYGQIRAKVYLTLGTVFPEDLCCIILEYAMIAEEIPSDPRVSRRPVPFHAFQRMQSVQAVFREEYQCPKFRDHHRKASAKMRQKREAKQRLKAAETGSLQEVQ